MAAGEEAARQAQSLIVLLTGVLACSSQSESLWCAGARRVPDRLGRRPWWLRQHPQARLFSTCKRCFFSTCKLCCWCAARLRQAVTCRQELESKEQMAGQNMDLYNEGQGTEDF